MSQVQNQADENVDAILLAARYHHVDHLRSLLQTGSANVQDPETGSSPLHVAIASLGASNEEEENTQLTNGHETASDTQRNHSKQNHKSRIPQDVSAAAKQTVVLLLQNGAIWNDLDTNGETSGCIAYRLGLTEIYDLIVDAGVRAEILLSRLEEYERLDDDEDEDEDEDEDSRDIPGVSSQEQEKEPSMETQGASQTMNKDEDLKEVTTNKNYLRSNLTFSEDRILDEDRNGVMMAWETNIMKRSADLLFSPLLEPSNTSTAQYESGHEEQRPEEAPATDQQAEPRRRTQPEPSQEIRVLNIGHGMGIIDRYIQSRYHPSSHHIVEAHPSVLSKLSDEGWNDMTGVMIHAGRWQDVLPRLLEQGEMYEVIYFDTFAEEYSALRRFFQEFVTGLLSSDGEGDGQDGSGRWGFFNGLGADRRVCYDVYTKVG